jgi:hypothetical protein
MPSRSGKERKNDNPLSKARRVGAGKTAVRHANQATITAAETKAKEIWFRKSGAGVACFVAYYSQVLSEVDFGECVMDSASVEIKRCNGDGGTASLVTAFSTSNEGIGEKRSSASGLGLSRAAQRRKRRKGGGGNDPRPAEKYFAASGNVENFAQSKATTDKEAHVAIASDHPLWKAVAVASARQPSSLQSPVEAKFFAALTRPLPLTFRIRHTAREKDTTQLLQELQAYNDLESTIVKIEPLLGKEEEVVATNDERQPLARLDVYQAACPKAALPDSIKDLLVEASQNGCIARQEVGSMLPVAALVQAGAFASTQQRERSSQFCSVLDMCASPGSKTLQVLEVLLQLTTANASTNKSPSSIKNSKQKSSC